MKSLGRVRLFATPWTAAHQAPPSMGFSRKSQARVTGVGCHCLPHITVYFWLILPWKWKLLSHVWLFATRGILQARLLEWTVVPFSRGSSQPSDQTQVSRIASRGFTSWATREAQEHWSGKPIPSPVDLPDLGIEPGSPALQADSWPTELPGKLPFLPLPLCYFSYTHCI